MTTSELTELEQCEHLLREAQSLLEQVARLDRATPGRTYGIVALVDLDRGLATIAAARRAHESADEFAEAFAAWRSRDLYYGNDKHYRLRSTGRIAPYDKQIRTVFSSVDAFHTAAEVL